MEETMGGLVDLDDDSLDRLDEHSSAGKDETKRMEENERGSLDSTDTRFQFHSPHLTSRVLSGFSSNPLQSPTAGAHSVLPKVRDRGSSSAGEDGRKRMEENKGGSLDSTDMYFQFDETKGMEENERGSLDSTDTRFQSHSPHLTS